MGAGGGGSAHEEQVNVKEKLEHEAKRNEKQKVGL